MLNISRDFLYEEYVSKEKTIKEISVDMGVSVGAVFNYLKRYGIQTRVSMTERTKKKISNANKGKESIFKGTHLSEERKRKMSEAKKGVFHKKTKYGGHKKKRKDGYIAIYCPGHHRANKEGYVMEHILIMEEHIKRALLPDEVVHHINKVRDDNRIENLQLMTFKEHAGFHMRERWAKKKGAMTYQ